MQIFSSFSLPQTITNLSQKKSDLILVLGENLENQDVLDTFNNILDIVNNCENVSANFVKEGKVENAVDYLMDAQILKMSHDLMGSTVEKMGSSEFNEDECIAALTNLITMDNGDQNFDKLAEMAMTCWMPTNVTVSLLGAIDFDAAPRPEKIRKETQRIKKPLEPTKAPTNVKQLSKNNQGAEKINVVRSEIQRICRQRNSDVLPYYELICDPQSFMKSMDIAFQISFLIRDGFLGLRKVNGEPHIFLVDPDPMSQHTQTQHASDTVQCIMTMNPKQWREKIASLKIRKPLLLIDDEGGDGALMEVDSD